MNLREPQQWSRPYGGDEPQRARHMMARAATDQEHAMMARKDLANFNPDARLNPHNVDHTGAGRLYNGSKFDATRSSTPGGIFGGESNEPKRDMSAINRVKARSSHTDFLDRLAIAEENDSHREPNPFSHARAAAGARPAIAGDRLERGTTPQSNQSRAAAIMAKQQRAMDQAAEAQRQRQWSAMERQGLHPAWQLHRQNQGGGFDSNDGGRAAGGLSKGMQNHMKNFAQQQQHMARSNLQQNRQHQQQLLQQQRAHEQAQMNERQQRMEKQRLRQEQQRQMLMEDQARRSKPRAVGLDNRQVQNEAFEDVAAKTAWARSRHGFHNTSGITLG